MNKTIVFLCCLTLLAGSFSLVPAQQRKRRPAKPAPVQTTAPPLVMLGPVFHDCRTIDAPAEVTIGTSGELLLGGKAVEKAGFVAELTNYICDKAPDEQVVYINAAAETPFQYVTEVMRLGRKIEVDDYVLVGAGESTGRLKIPYNEPKEPRVKSKPYVHALIVALAADGALELNGKPETLDSLVAKLRRTFAVRGQKRIYMAGSRDVEKTVFIYGRAGTRFGDVRRLVREIEKTGADPIGLDIDDGYPLTIF